MDKTESRILSNNKLQCITVKKEQRSALEHAIERQQTQQPNLQFNQIEQNTCQKHHKYVLIVEGITNRTSNTDAYKISLFLLILNHT